MPAFSTVLSTFFSAWTALSSSLLVTSADLWIDDHHAVEDIGITLGQAISAMLGDKAGCNRMWSEKVAIQGGGSIVCVIDLSNRPDVTSNVVYTGEFVDAATTLSAEMVHHFVESLMMNAKITCHLVFEAGVQNKDMDVVVAVLEAIGKCMDRATTIDARRQGQTASSKGTLAI